MKKFFASLAAVAFMFSAYAATATSVIDVAQANADIKSHKVNTGHKVAHLQGLSQFSLDKAAVRKAEVRANMSRPVKGSAKYAAASTGNHSENYLHTAFGFFGETDFEQDVYDYYTFGISKIEFYGNKVYVDGLFGAETTLEGVYDEESSLVVIPMDQMTTIEGMPVTFFVFNHDELTAYDLVFSYNPEDHSLIYETNEDMTEAIYISPEKFTDNGTFNYYFEAFGAYFNEINSYMTWTLSKQGVKTDMLSYIYAETDPAATMLSIGNAYGGFYNDYNLFFWVDMTLDLEAKQATATGQSIAVTNSDSSSEFLLWSKIEGKMRAVVTYDYKFETGADGDYTVLEKDEIFIGYVVGSGANGYYVYDSKIYVPFVIQPTGVKDVEVSASATHVEYFNLQGVRVANPENGLYIRRNGSDVSKVFVK